MHATIRIGPAQRGHASGSTLKICRSNAAHRRVASVGASVGKIRRRRAYTALSAHTAPGGHGEGGPLPAANWHFAWRGASHSRENVVGG